MGSILWAFYFFTAFAADPPATVSGGTTYIPPSSVDSPAVRAALTQGQAPTNAQQTPSTQKPPTNIGQIPTPDTIPAPSTTQGQSLGQYLNSRKEVKLDRMFLDRYKQSVVRVSARDLAGNILAQAMGVGVGRSGLSSAQYIATPLSIILGNNQQWADEIQITHHTGNHYTAKIALIDEEKNLVLLAPETTPAAIPFVDAMNERPQVSVFTIGFRNATISDEDNLGGGAGIEPFISRGQLAAANSENGILSVSGKNIDDSQAGSGIIDTTGKLVGMLLPGGKGVLASALQRMIAKASLATPIEPSRIGAILGRGVIVSARMDGAYRSISEALEAIKKGEAPKADSTRYFPAKNRALAPKEIDKVVIKVMPGTYREKKPIILPSDISLSGSGAGDTTIIGSDPEKPVILAQDASNIIVSGFRFVPAPLQKLKAPAVIFSKVNDGTLLGNIFEAKGGVGFWAVESRGIKIIGNTFARSEARGISCDRSSVLVESNAFIGDWPIAFSGDKNCRAEIRRNLFHENKTAIAISSLTEKLSIERNSFIRCVTALKVTGDNPRFSLDDNLFYESQYALYSTSDFDIKKIGRNSVWRSKFQARGREFSPSDTIRTEPKFVSPENYDFRISSNKGQLGVAAKESGADLGAYQRSDFLGGATQQLARTLGVTIGNEELPTAWGVE